MCPQKSNFGLRNSLSYGSKQTLQVERSSDSSCTEAAMVKHKDAFAKNLDKYQHILERAKQMCEREKAGFTHDIDGRLLNKLINVTNSTCRVRKRK